MLCTRCRKEISEDARFCPECGTALSEEGLAAESEVPLLTLKPKFVPLVALMSDPILQGFLTFLAIFVGSIAAAGVETWPRWFAFVLYFCLVFFGVRIIIYLAKKKTYERTEYRFYKTRLEYYEGFFTVEEKAVSYEKIAEVYMSKSVFQKKYGLGAVILSTPATGSSGIRLADIENPGKVYLAIKELVRRV